MTFSFWYRTVAHKDFVQVLGGWDNGFRLTLKNRNAKTRTAEWTYAFIRYHGRNDGVFIGPDATQWVHVVFRYNIGNLDMACFINGELKATAPNEDTVVKGNISLKSLIILKFAFKRVKFGGN